MTQQVRTGFSLIRQKACRDLVLTRAEQRRPGQFTKVSSEVYAVLDRQVAQWIDAIVQNADPSKRTVK